MDIPNPVTVTSSLIVVVTSLGVGSPFTIFVFDIVMVNESVKLRLPWYRLVSTFSLLGVRVSTKGSSYVTPSCISDGRSRDWRVRRTVNKQM